MTLTGSRAIVTGAGQGIGKAIAIELAARGADVQIFELNAETAAQAAGELAGRFPDRKVTAFVGSVTDTADVERAFDQAESELGGPVDLLVNNAGYGELALIVDMTDDQWTNVVDLCLGGPFLTSRAFAQRLIAAGAPGAVVNISSLNYTAATDGLSAYCAAKAGVAQFTKVCASEWGRFGIRVNAVAPGATRGDPMLEARDLWSKNRVKGVNVTLYRGEVTGLVGFVGSGRTELVRLLFGADRPDRGDVLIEGKPLRHASPRVGIARGVALLPEDRRHQASIGTWSVRENLTLSAIKKFSKLGFINRRAERAQFAQDKARLGIKAPNAEANFSHLSGGNQQKVVIAKWLATDAQIMLFDEPTQGVDVGAQEEIHRVMRDIAHDDRVVVMVSSDLSETVRISDRLLIMREGQIVGDMPATEATMEEILSLCFGGAAPPHAERAAAMADRAETTTEYRAP